ncbi:MAG: SGNH/GDSL hydrolase family protein [Granulosicoccus sp.]
MSDTKRIMCFGDSLTWGWVPTPNGPPTTRYPFAERWPGVVQAALGPSFEIIEEGLSGRTTQLDDPIDPRLNGAAYLPSAIASHLPLDMVIIMLGTNDSKYLFHRSAFEIASSIAKLIDQVNRSGGGVGTAYPAPMPFIIAPPPLGRLAHPWTEAHFGGAHQKINEMATHYAALADYLNIGFLNAGDVMTTDGVDGIHFTAENNADLGSAVAEKVSGLFSTSRADS